MVSNFFAKTRIPSVLLVLPLFFVPPDQHCLLTHPIIPGHYFRPGNDHCTRGRQAAQSTLKVKGIQYT